MATPIIVNNTRTIDCIIQEGKKYCESTNLTAHEWGIILLVVGAFIAYTAFLIHIAVDKDRPLLAFLLGVLAPLIIGGLILI